MKSLICAAIAPTVFLTSPTLANTLDEANAAIYAEYVAANYLYSDNGFAQIEEPVGAYVVRDLVLQSTLDNLDVDIFSRHGLRATNSGGLFTVDRSVSLGLGPAEEPEDAPPTGYTFLSASIFGDYYAAWDIETSGLAIISYNFDVDPTFNFSLDVYLDGEPPTVIPLSGAGQLLVPIVAGQSFQMAVTSGFLSDDLSPNDSFFASGSGRVSLRFTDGAVPEPATWAMMIAGFGLVGTAVRRRRLAVIAN